MNSSICNIETPKKKYICNKPPVSPPVLKTFGRFSPSKPILELLENANRIHQFQFHTEVNFKDLSELNCISNNVIKHLSDYVNTEHPDIPNVIVQLEIIALETGFYGQFLKDYISEEFNISSEYSFCVFASLNYMEQFNLSVDVALRDLFHVSFRKLLKQRKQIGFHCWLIFNFGSDFIALVNNYFHETNIRKISNSYFYPKGSFQTQNR